MKLKLGQYAKRIKKSRYEVLRMIMRNEVRYEEVIEDGKKVYYIYTDQLQEEPSQEKVTKEILECEGLRIELEKDRLILYRDGNRTVYQKVE